MKMESVLTLAQSGLGLGGDAPLTLLRIGVGIFFASSGSNKLFNHNRHQSLVQTLEQDHVPLVRFNQWWVPINEMVGGIMVAANVLTAFFAAVLLVISIVACAVDGTKRVTEWKPINTRDRIADWLYLPEVLYAMILSCFIL
jgi:putative oxidoreductase